ncbi:hypothetical protein GQ457_06G034410 [Hibiscus cannabinus]
MSPAANSGTNCRGGSDCLSATHGHLHGKSGRRRRTRRVFSTVRDQTYTTAAIAELGFTVNTLLDMKEEELDEMMMSVSQIFMWELLIGEMYDIKAAVRAERRRLEELKNSSRPHLVSGDTNIAIDALFQGGGGTSDMAVVGGDDDENGDTSGVCYERQREHPLIITEPGEIAPDKKNCLDYLFNLYEQCREFLIQVTNQVFIYVGNAGASHINRSKMRYYLLCYALHCLDEDTSNALRRAFKERGENVSAWRQACYKPVVAIVAHQGWNIDAVFNAHPRLAIWHVPAQLRRLCCLNWNIATASSSVSGIANNSTVAYIAGRENGN